MGAPSNHLVDVTDATFEQAVLAESARRPVVVDFWAPWCQPCLALGPVLEKLAAEGAGAWLLAKLDTDQNQQTAGAFQIRGIPAVKGFVDGAVKAEFTGMVGEPEVRAFLEQLVPSPADDEAKAADRALTAVDLDGAHAHAKAALELAPRHPLAHLVRGELALLEGDTELAREHLEAFTDSGDIERRRHIALARLEVALLARSLPEGSGESDNPHTRLARAADWAIADRLEDAWAEALDVLAKHRATHKEPAHKLCLALLELAAEDHRPALRKQLANALF